MEKNQNDFQYIKDISFNDNSKFCIKCNSYLTNTEFIQINEKKNYLCKNCCQTQNLSIILKEKGIITSEEEIENIEIICQFHEKGCLSFFKIKDIFIHKEKCPFKEKASNNIEISNYTSSDKFKKN